MARATRQDEMMTRAIGAELVVVVVLLQRLARIQQLRVSV
jgi:hypothetical protein